MAVVFTTLTVAWTICAGALATAETTFFMPAYTGATALAMIGTGLYFAACSISCLVLAVRASAARCAAAAASAAFCRAQSMPAEILSLDQLYAAEILLVT